VIARAVLDTGLSIDLPQWPEITAAILEEVEKRRRLARQGDLRKHLRKRLGA